MLEKNIDKLVQKIIESNAINLKAVSNNDLFHEFEYLFKAHDEWILLHIYYDSLASLWVYPTLYPKSLTSELKQQLPQFHFLQPEAGYGVVCNGSNCWIEPYWGIEKNFNHAEVPLFFHRRYDGHKKGHENYIEFNQLITHSLDLHWSSSKCSYCVLDEMGDEVEIIKIIEHDNVKLNLIKNNALNTLLNLGGWNLVRYFEFSLKSSGSPTFDRIKENNYVSPDTGAIYNTTTFGKNKNAEIVISRGAQLTEPSPEKNCGSTDFYNHEKKHLNFIIEDTKNQRLLEDYSIDPANFSSYFINSDLPYEVSPIYFNARVLDKYKHEPDKYKLTERSIKCRGGWSLRTYDINDYHQVHTYAIYLSQLPEKEQLHWKSHNEKPKGSISERALKTDFLGEFPETRSPLERLRMALEQLANVTVGDEVGSIWKPKRGSLEKTLESLHYVRTENSNDWLNFVSALSNATIEGFDKKALTAISVHYGYEKNNDYGTLGLIKYILENTGHNSYVADISDVLKKLRRDRSTGNSHGDYIYPAGSLIADANEKLEAVITAIEKLTEIFQNITMTESERFS